MTNIFVDADACPVKEEVYKVALRHQIKVWIVSNGGIRPQKNPLLVSVFVQDGLDEADDWIAERAKKGDVVVFHNTLLNDSATHPKINPKSLHGGMPVVRGEKWMVNLWFRENLRY